jgi:hypothetical protein
LLKSKQPSFALINFTCDEFYLFLFIKRTPLTLTTLTKEETFTYLARFALGSPSSPDFAPSTADATSRKQKSENFEFLASQDKTAEFVQLPRVSGQLQTIVQWILFLKSLNP